MNSSYSSFPNDEHDDYSPSLYNRPTYNSSNSSLLGFHTSFNTNASASILREDLLLAHHNSHRSIVFDDEAEECAIQYDRKKRTNGLGPSKATNGDLDAVLDRDDAEKQCCESEKKQVIMATSSTVPAELKRTQPSRLLKEATKSNSFKGSAPLTLEEDETIGFDLSLDLSLLLASMRVCENSDKESLDGEESLSDSFFGHDSIQIAIARRQRRTVICNDLREEKSE